LPRSVTTFRAAPEGILNALTRMNGVARRWRRIPICAEGIQVTTSHEQHRYWRRLRRQWLA